jgi:hypothetical protein
VAARQAAILAIKNGGDGMQPDYEIRIRLPSSLKTFEKITWESAGWDDLPLYSPPLSLDAEQEILDTLIDEINSTYSLNLDSVINLNRLPDANSQPVPSAVPPKVVVFGASNAGRLVALLIEAGLDTH